MYVTILLRAALLPFSLISERNKMRNRAVAEEVHKIQKEHADDPALRKEMIRRIFKKRKVQPWAKIVVLGMHALFLIVLYQVFLQGLSGQRMYKLLYPSVQFPGAIDTHFYGFDLAARHDSLWAGIVALLVFAEVYADYRIHRRKLRKTDLLYFVVFPAVVFLFFWWLPMAKSLFILTSSFFSVIIYEISKPFFRPKALAKGH